MDPFKTIAVIDRLSAALAAPGERTTIQVARMATEALAEAMAEGSGWVVEADPWNPGGGILVVSPSVDGGVAWTFPLDAPGLHAGLDASGATAKPSAHRLSTAAMDWLKLPVSPATTVVAIPIINRVVPAADQPSALWGWIIIPTAVDPDVDVIAIAQRLIQIAIDAAAERQLHAVLFRHSPHPINLHAGQQRRRSNPAQEHFIGFRAATIDADPGLWARISHPEDQALQDAAVARLWRGEIDRFNLDKRYTLPDGRVVWGRNTYLLIRDHAGRVQYQISYLVDLTQIKLAEHAAQDALAEAQRALAVRARFLANASHEMRTPLHGIASALELLADCNSRAEVDQLLETVRVSSAILLRLVNDVLELARVESENFCLESRRCELRVLLPRWLAALRPLISAEVELTGNCHDDVPAEVLIDYDRVQQILTNIIGNAAKFTQSGQIAVTIERRNEASPGQVLGSGEPSAVLLGFVVRDSGVGMTQEQLDQAFAPFSPTTAPIVGSQPRGSGLGLAIVRSLIQRMGGSVSVQSAPGAGTIMDITLPVHLPAEVAVASR